MNPLRYEEKKRKEDSVLYLWIKSAWQIEVKKREKKPKKLTSQQTAELSSIVENNNQFTSKQISLTIFTAFDNQMSLATFIIIFANIA